MTDAADLDIKAPDRRPSNDDPRELVGLFAREFRASENTILVPGDDEPLYLPADATHRCHRIVFAHGFFASALHEIAHWCIAGRPRRQLVDYGYWYRPDGRDAGQQRAFEAVETAPQAIEWAFTLASDRRFHVSLDNLGDVPVDPGAFRRRVHDRLARYVGDGFPSRAERFMRALERHYGTRFRLP